MSSEYIILTIIALSVAVFLLSRRTSEAQYPPGPPALPIIGHLWQSLSIREQDTFLEWSKTYGDVICLRVPGSTLIALNSHEAANDLLDKRGALYNDRPNFRSLELLGWFPLLALSSLRSLAASVQSGIIHKQFSKSETAVYRPVVLDTARTVLRDLLAQPSGYDSVFFKSLLSVTMRIAWGQDLRSDEHDLIQRAREVLHAFNSSGSPGNNAVDRFPVFQYFPSWFPFMKYVNHARKFRPMTRKFIDHLHDTFLNNKQHVRLFSGESSFMSVMSYAMENMPEDKVNDPEYQGVMKGLGAQILLAAVDTTWTTLSLFVIMMLIHPDVQRKAQAEIDHILEGTRLPTFADRESLPYIDCIVQEVLRIYPSVPLGVAHVCTQDNVYRGYLIPKGSIVFANAKAISLDEKVYKNPEQFNPTRYLPKPVGNGEPPFKAAFGHGRRICPGRFLADDIIWIVIASVLTVFDIHRGIDADGREVAPTLDFTYGMVEHPSPVKCEIRPRSAAAAQLVSALY
ncbi:cytochrome P450 [Fistulina hepatica ATCC 64428]|uniref:Cytochrome P450 n=1 Tax=Fistulina hepatica ATCC 64428 TaxID=1128425 RepID=A0A0D7AF97_9AGAR|nr:cytochrome P450 [Fistulina hepatica ATCC 64428]